MQRKMCGAHRRLDWLKWPRNLQTQPKVNKTNSVFNFTIENRRRTIDANAIFNWRCFGINNELRTQSTIHLCKSHSMLFSSIRIWVNETTERWAREKHLILSVNLIFTLETKTTNAIVQRVNRLNSMSPNVNCRRLRHFCYRFCQALNFQFSIDWRLNAVDREKERYSL